jgi:hypothetical protein
MQEQNAIIRIGNTVIAKKAKPAQNPQKNTFTFTIKNEVSPHLMKSIGDRASFEATSVLTLRDYLKRCHHATELFAALHLVHDLGRQMEALIAGGRGIACIGVDDVAVILHRESDAFTHADSDSRSSTLGDSRLDPRFLFLNDRLIFEVDESDGALLIDRALTKPKSNDDAATAFMSPELLETLDNNKTKASASDGGVHFKTAYYSAAQLVIYFLLNVVVMDSGHHTEDSEQEEHLRPIKSTKLYWFLLRCLNRVPSERKYVYI